MTQICKLVLAVAVGLLLLTGDSVVNCQGKDAAKSEDGPMPVGWVAFKNIVTTKVFN